MFSFHIGITLKNGGSGPFEVLRHLLKNAHSKKTPHLDGVLCHRQVIKFLASLIRINL